MVKYAYSNPKEKRGKYRVEPSVFAVHKEEPEPAVVTTKYLGRRTVI